MKTVFRTSWPAAILSAVLLGVTGCGSAPPVPVERYYRIAVPAPKALSAPVLPGLLAVAPLQSDGLHSERALLYADQGQPRELRRYHYHHWADSPPRLLQEQLVAYLRQARAAATVLPDDPRLLAEYRVVGRLVRFERLNDAERALAAVELELGLERKGSARPVWLHQYRAEMPARDGSVAAVAEAFEQAVGDVYGRFLSDLEAAGRATAP
jgi:ABC-type uncharacterized transport system auxiliary subunit